jgi:Caspase domain
MSRLLLILFASIVAYGPAASAIAQSVPTTPSSALAPLLQQNRLLADVARDDPDNLWNMVSKISVLVRNPRDGGASRTAATPTQAEASQIAANPALRLAYDQDPAATLSLLRATNEELKRARLRVVQDQPRRLALVVGSSGDGKWGKLATTQNDANLVAGALTRQGFAISGGGALIDLDKPHLLDAIKTFAHSIEPGTIALFYYAGHGVQANARNFIVPAGAAIPQTDDDYDRNLVALDDAVLQQMQQANGRLNILILDACRDHPPLLSHGAATHGSHQLAKGLAPMGAPSAASGTMIIYSTGPNGIARDGANGAADSPFASAFAAAVSAGGLEMRDVFDRVQVAVDQATDHQQQPWISYSTADKFYFNTTHGPDGASRDMLDANGSLCPKPGTRVTFMDASRTVTGTYQPVDPADPALCRMSTSTGETRTLLYNLYDTKALSDRSSVSRALKDLLSGRKDQVEFQTQLTTNYPFPIFVESWTRLGQESLEIGTRHVQAIVFEHDIDRPSAQWGTAIGQYRKRWKVWYDPVMGVVGQRELSLGDTKNAELPDETHVIFVSPF